MISVFYYGTATELDLGLVPDYDTESLPGHLQIVLHQLVVSCSWVILILPLH